MRLLGLLSGFLFILITQPCCVAFELSELPEFQQIAIKTFVRRDSPISGAKTIQATKELEEILGREKKDYVTDYVYLGGTKLEEDGFARYYYFYPPSYNGRGKGELKYAQNSVMHSGIPGDILVMAKGADDRLLLLIIQKNSPSEQELYSVLGMTRPDGENTSWWRHLWSSNDTQTGNYEIDSAALPVPAIPEKSWARIYFTPGPDCENNIIAGINAASRAIDVAVYSITNDRIVDSLLAAHRRGVRVRVISDKQQAAGRASLIGRIRDSGIPVVLNKRHKIMHHKFAIFDHRDIETGSYNWTSSATQSNAENCMFFPEQNKEFTNQFKYLWGFYQS